MAKKKKKRAAASQKPDGAARRGRRAKVKAEVLPEDAELEGEVLEADAVVSSRGEPDEKDEGEEEDEELDEEDLGEPDEEDLGEPDVDLPAPAAASKALAPRDPFQAYLREVQRYPLLTAEEERDLTRKYAETQDPKIARRLVTANLRLVIKLAYEYRRAYKNMMDLIQEGNIGLMQAVSRYDPYRGVKLSSYSAWWIRAYMLRFILNNWRLVKLGTTQAQRKLFFNLNRQKAKLSAMGIDPTPKLIAERLGVKEGEVVEMDRRLSSGEASLDAPLGDAEGRRVARVELMPSQQKSTDDKVASAQLGELLNEHLAKFRERLSGKDLEIFDKRMVADEPLTLQRLGEEFGVSRERVRQLEARLAGRLRDYLKQQLGDAVEFGA